MTMPLYGDPHNTNRNQENAKKFGIFLISIYLFTKHLPYSTKSQST